MKYIIYFLITVIVLLITPDVKAQNSNPQDTVKKISLNDLREFNGWLTKNISYEEYTKLTPDAVLSRLYMWSEEKLKPKTIKK